MILYRVVQENWKEKKGINDNFDGYNTFNYSENQDYMHFFILPECAKIYQQLKYKNKNKKSFILKCNIPYFLIKDNFGCGMYRWFDPHVRTPFLEVRIKYKDFNENMILDVTESVKSEWENKEIYERFLSAVVYNSSNYYPIERKPNYENNESISLNPKFNFLHFFPKEQLTTENIICDDYPISNTSNFYKNSNYSSLKDFNNTNIKKSTLSQIRDALLNNFGLNKRR